MLRDVVVTFTPDNAAAHAGFTLTAQFIFDRVAGRGTPMANIDVLQFAWDRYRVIQHATPGFADEIQNLGTAPAYTFDQLRRGHVTTQVAQTDNTFSITLNDGPGWTGHGAGMPVANDLWYVFSPVWAVVDTAVHLLTANPGNQGIGAVLNGSLLQTPPLYVSIQGIRAAGARAFAPAAASVARWDVAAGAWNLPAGGPFAALPATPPGY